MAARLAQQIAAARYRITSLECSLRVYAQYPEARNRVAQQIDEAYGRLAELERQAEEARR